ATGLPAILGAVGGIPELIEEGTTGFLVKPDDVTALGERLDELIRDRALRLRMGKAARRAVEARFNTEQQITQIVERIDRDGTGPRRRYAFGLAHF
ncbi:MAG TPA: glycosyltransferase, partial [Polyangiaceae bacterium]|nr:glycosyltransferase [Polyangiaceae bacterium]